ncbi:phospholipase D-like domain-containing protein [Mesorhizobium amorphae]|uniref:phospholipase D-like domain-containing protein n=1 Tax=Mesorhizobium amorphae TaxID=71433 RepID=UPI001781A4A0|nr:phospholipase D-like domain-containing protein [Mesorhizobium amorphae]
MPLQDRTRSDREFLAGLLRRRPQDRAFYENRLKSDLTESAAARSRVELETIVSEERPVLFVKKGKIDFEEATIRGREAADLVANLARTRERIEPLMPLIGRIDVVNFPNGFPYVGTGWFLETDIVVTNRHVAELIARWDGRRYAFTPGTLRRPMQPTLHLGHEYDDLNQPEDPKFPVMEVLYIEPENGPHDVAFLRVDRRTDGQFPGRIEIADADLGQDCEVCVIGYPAVAPRHIIPDQDLMNALYLGRYNIKRVAPGFMMRAEPTGARHDCTTLGGNSGSVVIDTATGKAGGLHFAGLYREANYAVPASILRDYVARRRWLTPPAIETRAPAFGAAPSMGVAAAPVEVTVGASGVTIPLTITVSLGTGANRAPQPDISGAGATAPEAVEMAAKAYWRSRPTGVVAVRVGYDETDGHVGDVPIIVASVDPRALPGFTQAPSNMFGAAIHYEAASLLEQLDARHTLEAAVSSVAYDDDARVGEPFSFEPVGEDMEVIAHVGPEYSWATLQRFLGEATGQLVSGIYEFRGPHIRDALKERLDAGGSLTLVMDNSTFAKIREEDASVEFPARETFAEWAEQYGSRFERVVAPEGATGLIANAYHIKVTVRDDDTFWLSSGNWKLTSSQPAITQDQLDNAMSVDLPGNREWHVVVKSPTLSRRLRAHLLQDFTHSGALGAGPLPRSMTEEMVAVTAETEALMLERPAPRKILEPLPTQRRQMSVQYLLTPDKQGEVYGDAVLRLIRSARSTLYFQIPYIGMPASPDADRGYIDDLIQALTKKLKTLPDARLLLRQGGKDLSDPRHAAWYFKSKGVDIASRVRVIADHHTKGMIVDGQRVLIGSHNWSSAGVTLNRDASLIFDDREISGYFAEAFLIDWDRSSPVQPRKSAKAETILLDRLDESVSSGQRLVPLSAFLDD